jgi:acyl carrier protein
MRREELFDLVKGNVSKVIHGWKGTVLESYGLRDLGGHSLQGAEIVSLSMQQLGIKVARERLLDVRDFGQLLDLFEESLG